MTVAFIAPMVRWLVHQFSRRVVAAVIVVELLSNIIPDSNSLERFFYHIEE